MTRTPSLLTDASDATLVACIATEPDAAIVELYRRHARAVRARAMGVLGDPDLADGVVQEVFLRLWEQPESFDPRRGSLRGFLTVQGRSRAIEQQRANQARTRRERCSGPVMLRGGDRPSPEQTVVARIVAEKVHRVVAALPEAERCAIETAYFGDHTYRDVAVLLDCPEGTVKTRIRSGLGHLRGSIAAEDTSEFA